MMGHYAATLPVLPCENTAIRGCFRIPIFLGFDRGIRGITDGMSGIDSLGNEARIAPDDPVGSWLER